MSAEHTFKIVVAAALLGASSAFAQTLGDIANGGGASETAAKPAQSAAAQNSAQNPAPVRQVASDEKNAAQNAEITPEKFDKIFADASSGDAVAQLTLGTMYARGIKPAVFDIKTAVSWLEKAASGGNVPAMNFLGAIYGDKKLGCLDYAKAVKWRETAAQKGSPEDKFALANSFIYGYMLPADREKALYWLTAAGEAGHLDACNQLISIYSNRNDAESVKYWKQRKSFAQLRTAQNGDPAAMFDIYRKYISGKGGFFKSVPKAIFWLKKSADAGYIPACDTLANLHISGRYVGRDLNAAAALLERLCAADANYALKLSALYSTPDFADEVKAQKWLDYAAKHIGGINKIHLAWKLWAGAGVKKDAKKAAEICSDIIEKETGGLRSAAEKMKADIESGKPAPTQWGTGEPPRR